MNKRVNIGDEARLVGVDDLRLGGGEDFVFLSLVLVRIFHLEDMVFLWLVQL